MIEVQNLTRIFRTYKKQPGFWGGVHGLFKREFEEIAAAKDVSFSIREGEFVGFLGPNGAGKTTTLKMLSGLIFPTSGTARVASSLSFWDKKTSSGGIFPPLNPSCFSDTSTDSLPPSIKRPSTNSWISSTCAPSSTSWCASFP